MAAQGNTPTKSAQSVFKPTWQQVALAGMLAGSIVMIVAIVRPNSIIGGVGLGNGAHIAIQK